MNKPKITATLAVTSALALSSCLNIATAAGWSTVPLGGGGYVTGLACNSNASTIYCRTDVGGAFRWEPAGDATNGTWVSVTDNMVPFGTPNAGTLMGVESLSADPSNLSRVYMAAGNGIWGSDDKGATWYPAGTPDIATDGNFLYKECGERLAVDPNNPNVVWYGSREDGLQKGVKQPDGSWIWTVIPATSVPFGRVTGIRKAGVSFVVCDKNNGSTIIYAGVFDNVTTGTNTGGVYRSTNQGATWTKLPVAAGQTLTTPMRAQITHWGNIYLTAGSGGAFKYMKGSTSIEKFTTLPTGVSYVGVTADSNQGAVYLAEANGSTQYNRIWRTNDGGATWKVQSTFSQTRQEPDGTKALTGYWFGSIASLMANPNGGDELWVGDFSGVSRTRNSNALGGAGATWNTLQKDQEETVVLSLKNAATGPKLMRGLADVGGYRYNDISARPSGAAGNTFNNLPGGNITSLDFSEANANIWAAAWVESDGYGGSGMVSGDGGVSWARFGQLAHRTLYNSPTAGWENFDVGAYLARQKALNPNAVVTLIVQSSAWQTNNKYLKFSSKEGSNAPQLLVNGATTLLPTEDTMVITDTPTTNYGTHPELHAREYYGTLHRWSYIKFDLSTMPAITSATLRLYRLAGTDTTNAYSTAIHALDVNTWGEATLTWNTRPLFNGRAGVYASKPPLALNDTNAAGGGRIAVSSTEPDNIVWLPIGTSTPAYHTRDRGVTWSASTGGPTSTFSGIYTNGTTSDTGAQSLAADRVNGHFYAARFSIWDSGLGKTKHNIYRSTNNGATWSLIGSLPNNSYNQRSPQLMAAPVAGDLWFCDDDDYSPSGNEGGLWHSTNGGATWTKISGVGKVTSVSFGKATTGSGSNYATYIYGRVGADQVLGVYQSDNYGTSWTKLADPTIAEWPILAGDRQNENSVFLGTGGRGVFHYSP